MNARLHDSVSTGSASRDLFEEHLRADGLRLRKLALMVKRGDWTLHPNAEAAAVGTLTGPTPESLDALRAAVDRSNVKPAGRFE